MTQEEKQLLLKDLCGRLSYGVILLAPNGRTICQTDGNTGAELFVGEGWKPYLRPISSMTKEEMLEYSCFVSKEYDGYLNDDTPDFTGNHFVYIEDVDIFIDWLNENHFDYRDLIPKGLAIEVTEENNPYK